MKNFEQAMKDLAGGLKKIESAPGKIYASFVMRSKDDSTLDEEGGCRIYYMNEQPVFSILPVIPKVGRFVVMLIVDGNMQIAYAETRDSSLAGDYYAYIRYDEDELLTAQQQVVRWLVHHELPVADDEQGNYDTQIRKRG